jgi:PAS domain S-box-containing protein
MSRHPTHPDWLRVTLENMADPVVAADAAGRVVFMNPAAEQLSDHSLDSARERPLSEILPLVDEETREPVELFPFNGYRPAGPVCRRAVFVQPRPTADDRLFQLTVTPVEADSGHEPGAVIVLRDVTERVRAERALRESEERYRVFVEQSSEGVWRLECEIPVPIDLPEEEQIELFYKGAALAECNEVMARMYSLAGPEDLAGARLGSLLPQTDPHNRRYLGNFIRSGYRLSGAESHEVDMDGNPKVFLNNLVGVVEDGQLVRVWGTQLDITERKQLEEELRRRADELAAADRRKDQFLAMLAHELRNPLAPIRNAVELMHQVETSDPGFQQSREMVERQVRHLARLVDDLLDVSRITHGSIRLRKEAVDLGMVAERAVEATRSLIDSRGHQFLLELPDSPVRLEADPARLEQIMANLLNNAAKYTMPGGRIGLSVGIQDHEAVIRVRDTGIGVPPDVLERVFEPFVQSEGTLARTEGGLGVGLTLVRSLAEMHGGSVEAHSPGLGQGSEFVVRLPVGSPAPTVAAPGPQAAAAAPARPLRVLVVEDNLDAAESMAGLLNLWGHRVRVVHDGRSALEAARAEQPDAVLLDIGLPGLDGYEVARRLRRDLGMRQSVLVAMTGYGQPEDRRRSRESGIDHHFVKPVEPSLLRELLAGVQPVGPALG